MALYTLPAVAQARNHEASATLSPSVSGIHTFAAFGIGMIIHGDNEQSPSRLRCISDRLLNSPYAF